jgi:hypothetical protein
VIQALKCKAALHSCSAAAEVPTECRRQYVACAEISVISVIVCIFLFMATVLSAMCTLSAWMNAHDKNRQQQDQVRGCCTDGRSARQAGLPSTILPYATHAVGLLRPWQQSNPARQKLLHPPCVTAGQPAAGTHKDYSPACNPHNPPCSLLPMCCIQDQEMSTKTDAAADQYGDDTASSSRRDQGIDATAFVDVPLRQQTDQQPVYSKAWDVPATVIFLSFVMASIAFAPLCGALHQVAGHNQAPLVSCRTQQGVGGTHSPCVSSCGYVEGSQHVWQCTQHNWAACTCCVRCIEKAWASGSGMLLTAACVTSNAILQGFALH